MTGRFRLEKIPIMPIGLALTIVISVGCQLAGTPGGLSVNLPAEDQAVSGGDEVGGSGRLGEMRKQDIPTEGLHSRQRKHCKILRRMSC